MISNGFDFSRESTIKDSLFARMSAERGLDAEERTPLSLSALEQDAGLPAVGQSTPVAGDEKERTRER